MKAIVAVDQKWGIGFKGNLLVKLPGDMRYFRERTLGKILVVGRETLKTFPGGTALPGRTTVCLTRDRSCSVDYGTIVGIAQNPEYLAECKIVNSIEGCLDFLSNFSPEDVFVVGGASIYEQFLPYCETCLVTRINAEFEADSFFIDLDNHSDFSMIWESDTMAENGFEYRFTEYSRIKAIKCKERMVRDRGDNNRQESCEGSAKSRPGV